jgi:hypothetical protein
MTVKTPPRLHHQEPHPIDVLREPMAPIGHDEPLLERGRVLGLIALLAVLVVILVVGVNLRGPTTTLSWEGDWKDLVSAPTSELADWKDLVGSPTAPDTGDWKDTIG